MDTGLIVLVATLAMASGSPSPTSLPSTNELAPPAPDPNTALDGMYTECLGGLSFTCVQRKTLSWIDRFGRADKVPLLGGFVTLVKTSESQSPRDFDAIDDTDTLATLVDHSVDTYFDTHTIRLTTPWWLQSDPRSRSDSTIDLSITDIDSFEGRRGGGGGGHGGGGGGGGGGKRGMKKMMMMMCMMMMGKMIMMGPLMMGLTKMIALKALIIGSISLLISKIMILKKLKMGGGLGGGGGGFGGGGGGWSSGGGGGHGGGGWDRSHNLAYSAYATDS